MRSYLEMVLLAAGLLVATGRAEGPPQKLLEALKSSDLREVHLYRIRQGDAEPQTPDGAIGAVAGWAQGKTKTFYLDEQRRGTDFYLQPGLALGDARCVERGLVVLQYGYTRMAPDGSFPGIPDVVHCTEFLIEGTARALLLLQEAHDARYEAAFAELGPKLDRVCTWFVRKDVSWRNPERDLYPFNHRYYARAAGLAQASVLLHRPELMEAALDYARRGMALQTREGINPERGGYDVGYQVAGLLYAENFTFVCPDPGVRKDVVAMIGRGLGFMVARTDATGEVSVGSSTRMAKEKDREGLTKKLNYAAYASDLILGADLTGNPEFRRVGETVVRNRVVGAKP